MKKSLKFIINFSLIFILLLSIVSYEYKYDSYISKDYTAIEVTKPEDMNDNDFKKIIINEEFIDDILFKQRTIKNGKNIYKVYVNDSFRVTNIGLFSKVIYS